MKKYLCVLSVYLMLAVGVSTFPVYAAGQHFTDVPDSHWASSYINEMAEGGLISGYGGGIFGPADNFNIDQMATIICSAKGVVQKSENNYWAYGAVDYCINTLKCLPNLGDINAANYSVPCSRELAYYMLMTGLGVGADATATPNPQLDVDDIPDYAEIDVRYQTTILKAYQEGVTVGTDDKLTFHPDGLLNRAQAATMFVRAGWTEAATVATPVAEGKTIDEIYAALKASGKWEELNDGMVDYLQYKDTYCGKITVYINNGMAGRTLCITMSEASIEGNSLIEYSSYKYAGRQVVKSILDIVYPTQSQAAYMGLKDVLLQDAYEFGGSQYPSVLRWYDGRMYRCESNGESRSIFLSIGELNDEAIYNTARNAVRTSATLIYGSYAGGPMMDVEAFELDKW